MEINDKDKNKFVELTLKPEWGRGLIRTIQYGKANVLFENDPDQRPRDYPLNSEHLKFAENQDPAGFKGRARSTKPYVPKAPKVYPRYELSYLFNDFFKRRFPEGFADKTYLEDLKKGERIHKEQTIAYLKENLLKDNLLKSAVERKDAAFIKGHLDKTLDMHNLLFVQEKVSLRNGLLDDNFVVQFSDALVKVLEDQEVRQETMEAYFNVLINAQIEGMAKWPIATLFPYLLQSERHMFLKPEATKNLAHWLGFELSYETTLNWKTYQALLEMTKKVMEDLKAFGAKDTIDLQSFIWVVNILMAPPKVKKPKKALTEEPVAAEAQGPVEATTPVEPAV
jgi:hypothetical protein